jgi:hypothetical protein
MVAFALQLLPLSIIGLLLGGVALQLTAFATWRRPGQLQRCFAAHAGCALSMPVGLALCALALPVPLTILTDALLAVGVAWLLYGISGARQILAAANP